MQNLENKISIDRLIKEIINHNIATSKKKKIKKKNNYWRFDFSKLNLIKLITITLISIFLTILYFQTNKSNIALSETIDPNNTSIDSSIVEASKIKIYVSGEVIKSGVYELPNDARLIDALNIAGGLSKNGIIGENNLARVLQDGEQINFENKNNPLKNNVIKNLKQLNCVNLNDSDLKQLDALPGVGPVLAQRILDYRETNGRFAEVSQLSNVEGIGKSKLKTISEKACV
ncbi:MAG: helix-hairpin-helix domain-containing protein [Actinomycetes bacterium]